MAALGGSRYLAFGTSFLLRQQLNSGLKLFPRRLHDRRLRWPQSEGSRRFCTRRPGNIRPYKLRIRGLHFANFRFTASSSGLRLERIPENRTTKAKLETPYDSRRLNPINANKSSRWFSRAVQAVRMPNVSSRSTGLYSQLWPLTKK